MAAGAGTLIVKLKERGHLFAPLAVLIVVFLILVPLPADVLDIFITFNIIMSITILLMSTYIKDPVEFSVYPSLVLLASIYRLVLNISATRLILTRGEEGVNAAGKVIGSFGRFVVADGFLIGILVFVIIIAIQEIAATIGVGRAGEAAARFALDKMAGEPMGIDGDLNAGLITRAEVLTRRKRIEQEAEFFGTMEGAIKFTTKEANLSVIIILINIIGGILVGMTQKGMDFSKAGTIYTILAIGNGLVSAIPSLLITVSGGIISTRALPGKTLGEDMTQQVLFNHKPLMLAAIGLCFLALIPGLPKIPFFLLGGVFGYLSFRVKKAKEIEAAQKIEKEKKEPESPPEKIEALLKVDMLGLEIGYSLTRLRDTAQGGTLPQRIKSMKKQLALDLGIIVPPVRIRDNLQLGSREYSILIKGVPIVGGEVMPGHTIVDPAEVITTHLTEVIKVHAHELLGRQETQHLVDNLAASYPEVVEELIPNVMTLGNVRKVLQNLLKERVSIFDLRTILETLADYAPAVKDISALTELVRQALSRQLVKPYVTGKNGLPTLVLGGELENSLASKIQKINQVEQLIIEPEEARVLMDKIKSTIDKAGLKVQPILLCSSIVRHHLRQLTERFLPDLVILSASEVPKNIRIASLGVVE